MRKIEIYTGQIQQKTELFTSLSTLEKVEKMQKNKSVKFLTERMRALVRSFQKEVSLN